jgi:hypothetical protein
MCLEVRRVTRVNNIPRGIGDVNFRNMLKKFERVHHDDDLHQQPRAR